jgi:hypothetical protein
LKAIGSIADINSCPAISLENYDLASNTNLSDVTFSGQNSGAFYVGIDLENYPNAEKSKLFAGYNSTTDDIFWQPSYTNLAVANTRIDAYACYDQVVVFENGTAYVKF